MDITSRLSRQRFCVRTDYDVTIMRQEVRRIAEQDSRVRCIRRIGRRGLASAVIEGALSSSAAYVAVIDGDRRFWLRCIRPLRCDRAIVTCLNNVQLFGFAKPFEASSP